MLRGILSALLSHWRRKPLQLAMLLLGLSLATALWSSVQAINGEARASYARAASVLAQDRLQSVVSRDGNRFDQRIYVALRRAGWLVSPLLEGEKRYGGDRFRILGFDPLTLPPQARQVDLQAEGISLLSYLSPPGLFFVSTETAERLHGQQTPPLRILDALPPGTILTDIGNAQTILGAEGQVSRLALWPDQPLSRLPLERIAPGLTMRAAGGESDLARLTDSFHLNLTAFGFLAFAVGFFIVHAAIGLAFEQRRTMFRTLRAIGVPVRSLVLTLVVELLVFSALAGLAGVVLGYAVAAVLLPDVAASLRGLYGAEVTGSLSIRPAVWAAGLAIAVTGTLASSAGNLVKVWRLPELAPAQPRAWAMASARTAKLQAMAALALLLAAAGISEFGSGLAAGFALLGALLLGAALLLPPILSLVMKTGASLSRGALAQWFWADTRQQLPGLSLALMALLLALATNIGVGTMVGSFRQTFTGWLDQRLASELYVTARNEEEALRIRDWLTPRCDALLPIWNVDARIAGQPSLIYGIVDHQTYRRKWPLIAALPDVWDKVAASQALLVNEQLFRRAGLKLGDDVALPSGPALPISGVFSDYGNPKGQVIIANDLLVRLYPHVSKLRYAVRIDPGKATALAEALRKEFGLPLENVVDQASIKAFSLRIFDRTFAVTGALDILTLGVAGLAMLASLLTLSGIRLPQLAPVWAMGLTRRKLAWLELVRSLSLAALTMLLALPVGLGLAWALLAVVNVEAFGWRLPMRLFPQDWIVLAVLALIASALAAWLPARRLTRLSPAELLKVFVHER